MTIENGWLTSQEIGQLFFSEFGKKTAERFVRELAPALSRPRLGYHGKRGPKPLEWHYLALPLDIIVTFENRFRPHRLGTTKAAARGGTGFLETGEGGRINAFIRKTMMLENGISAAEMRRRCLAEFGPVINAGRIVDGTQPRVELPPLRTFQSVMRRLRQNSETDLPAN